MALLFMPKNYLLWLPPMGYDLSVFLVLWFSRSGLEQDDMRILYKYLTTSLFPRHSEPEVRGEGDGVAM